MKDDSITISIKTLAAIFVALLGVVGGTNMWSNFGAPSSATLSEGMLIMQSVDSKMDTHDEKLRGIDQTVTRMDSSQDDLKTDMDVLNTKMKDVEKRVYDVRVEQEVIKALVEGQR